MTRLKINETRKLLLAQLEGLRAYGYEPNLSRFALFKRENLRISSVQFLTNIFTAIQVEPGISVTVKEISDIWQQFNPHLSDDMYNTFWGSLLRLEFWFEGWQWDDFTLPPKSILQVYDSEDIEPVARRIREVFEKYAIPYVDRFGNVEGVNVLMNSAPEMELSNDNFHTHSALWHCPGFHVQGIVGLIASKLSGSPDYPRIKEIYTGRIKRHEVNDTMYGGDIACFYRVKEYLG